jgi:hypothetical protein
MTKWAALALLTLNWLVYFVVGTILLIPFGIAEPGHPHGDHWLAILWGFGESTWTWWVFARRKYDQEISNRGRWLALAVVIGFTVIAAAWALPIAMAGKGSRLESGRNRWETSALIGALVMVAGCWAGRTCLRLSRQPRHRVT